MNHKRSIVNFTVAAALAVMSGTASAAGFALIEQSASGLGNAFAGGAASAEDASTIFFNPAGMSLLQGKQIVVALHGIKPSAKFNDATSTGAAFQQTKAGMGGDAGSLAPVPNAYFAMEINPKTRLGVGINAPFGLQTEYESTWIGRFQAVKSKLETINLNPAVSYKLNDSVTVGAGVNYQHIKGYLSSLVNYSAAAAGALGSNLAGVSTVTGSDNAWGYNFGVLFNLSPQSRFGLAYRSSIKYTLSGSVSFSSVPLALSPSPLLANGSVNLAIKMPDTLSGSIFHKLNDKWDIMADATLTGWSVFDQLKVVRASGTTMSLTQENWKNTWRVAAGATHHYSDQWLARVGVAYDQSPVPDAFRTARIPDNDRTWLSLGGQYKPAKVSAVDFGYSHLFVSDASLSNNKGGVDNPSTAAYGNLVGSYQNSVDILSVQYTHSF
jgi:long-chain fatty acid transport protein